MTAPSRYAVPSPWVESADSDVERAGIAVASMIGTTRLSEAAQDRDTRRVDHAYATDRA